MIDIDVDSSFLKHIDAIVNKGREDAWRFIGIYGFPRASRKAETWELIRGLNHKFSLPWICTGDFNEILRSLEVCLGENMRCWPSKTWLMSVALWTWDSLDISSLRGVDGQGDKCLKGLIVPSPLTLGWKNT